MLVASKAVLLVGAWVALKAVRWVVQRGPRKVEKRVALRAALWVEVTDDERAGRWAVEKVAKKAVRLVLLMVDSKVATRAVL